MGLSQRLVPVCGRLMLHLKKRNEKQVPNKVMRRLVMEQKVARKSRDRDWASSFDDWKSLLVQPAVNGYLFKSGKDNEAKGEG